MAQYARYPASSVSVGSVNQGTPNSTANRWPVQVTDGTNLAGVTASGAVKVDGSATTQPVSGTFWQTTQPVSAVSLPLPTGAATAAKQPALGTAGTPSADVITVQGIASMTAVKVDGSGVTQPVSGTVTANAGTGTFTTDQTTVAATFQAEGSVAFGSLTNAYATVFTTGGNMKWIGLRNNTNQPVGVSLDGGTTTHFVLDAGDQVSLDLKELGIYIAGSTAIQAKYTGAAPTSGTFRVNGAR